MQTLAFDVNNDALRNSFYTAVLPQAIGALSGDCSPRWGRMTPQHMVEHLLWAFEISNGKLAVECFTPEHLLPRVTSFLRTNSPTPREFRNPLLTEGTPTLRCAELMDAKRAFSAELALFLGGVALEPDIVRTHPIFGPLNAEGWHRSHFKHCYHHLLQFGLLEEPATGD